MSRFATTNWSLILRAAASDAEAELAMCEAYWYPVYAFIRRQGCFAADAEDLTQGYLLNSWDHARALKRGGGRRLVSLDAVTAEWSEAWVSRPFAPPCTGCARSSPTSSAWRSAVR